MTTWLRRRPTVLPLLAATALLVAIGAGPAAEGEAWTGMPPPGLIRWVIGIIVGIMALAGLAILLAVRRFEQVPQGQRRSIWSSLLATAILVLMLSMLDIGEQELEPEETSVLESAEPAPVDLDPGPAFETGDGLALLVILVGAVVTMWWLRRPTAADEPEPGADRDDRPAFDSAVGRASRHLLDEHDPRHAVLLAYRDLEMTLEGLELHRGPTETPTEHLDRSLAALAITDPAQAGPLLELAGLYSRARFSDHAITEVERARAAEALDRAHRGLVGSP